MPNQQPMRSGGFVRLPLSFYGWIGLIVAAYIGSAEAAAYLLAKAVS